MSLVGNDVDTIIVKYLFANNNQNNTQNNQNDRRGYMLIRKIYYAFGKSNYNDFIIKCKNSYFEIEFCLHMIDNKDIYTLLQKIIHKTHPKNFGCYSKFNKELGNDLIMFNSLNRKHKLIVNFLSLYYGYLFVYTNTIVFDHFGYTYYNILTKSEYENKPLEYGFMRRKRIHNLKYFDLVCDSEIKSKRTYILKKNALIYKVGATSEIRDISCIKIM